VKGQGRQLSMSLPSRYELTIKNLKIVLRLLRITLQSS